ncbi:2-oxoglutarate-dependent dioxygenase DAO-like [Tripterygium wilfordii]|uniref:2-oxoglutarate-dependent dioxygenase DAO-like n=1 Tax=Tripterygium wilfordii TaxID=458696 RepID=UPI0018F83D68|nr:2-oxoglutarate-dependent dioxygenase DAO-like [Tripterygium wilfordii]
MTFLYRDEEIRNSNSEMEEKSAIPVIDLQNFPGKYEKLLREACEDWGCFRVVNHNIPISLMIDMKAVVRSLFDLPTEIKQRNTDAVAGSGYVARSEANPLYEALGLYDIGSSQAVQEFCSRLDASAHQRKVIEAYAKATNDLAMEISRKLAESMGLNGDLFENWPSQFRINKYHFTPETVGTLGVQLHTDSGFLTILQDDENVGGLEVMNNKSGQFFTVDPLPGTLVINFGDIGNAWSNGRFCNVKHRVKCKEATVRISIASFLLGPNEGSVEAPMELVDDQHPRLYVPFTWEDYRKLRLTTKHRAGESLADMLISTQNRVNA